MNRPLLAAVAGLAVLGTTAVGVYVVASPGGEEEVVQQVATATPSASATATPVVVLPSPTLSSTLTYTDPAYGYSFVYPVAWFLSPEPNNLILYSYDLASVKPEDAGKPVPLDHLKVFFWVAEGVDKPLEQWLAEGDNGPGGMSPPTVISSADVILGGRPGLIRITESEGYKDTSYYIPLGSGRIFVINAGPTDSLVWPQFLPVLASVTFPT